MNAQRMQAGVVHWRAAATRTVGRWAAASAAGLLIVAALAGCGGGSGGGGGGSGGEADPPSPPPPPASRTVIEPRPVSDYPRHAAELAAQLVQAGGPAEAVEAARMALSGAGVGVDAGVTDGLAARAPAASWTVDTVFVIDMAAEANDRARSGRMTLSDLGKLWADLGFPFRGQGTPGEQLLVLLRESLAGAARRPDSVLGFVPSFIAEMAHRQQPAFDLGNPASRPEDLRLTLLEAEMLHALMDRTVTVTGEAASSAASSAAAGRDRPQATSSLDGVCAKMQKELTAVEKKILDKGAKELRTDLEDAALAGIGLTKEEIKAFRSYGPYFDAVSSAMKLVKMLEIYTSGKATLQVLDDNPLHKPHHDEPRKLVSVKATVGVPDKDWQAYKDANANSTSQDIKSCLSALGAPLPPDLKDIGDDVEKWRVEWDLRSGAPEHAQLDPKVNRFDGSSAGGGTFGMKVVRTGEASAEAVLKVDILKESRLATLFQGPLKKVPVVVRAQVRVDQMPNPMLVVKVREWMGFVTAVAEIGAGWMQAMLPPTTTTTIEVQYHDKPTALQAFLEVDMTLDDPTFPDSGGQPLRRTVVATTSAVLDYAKVTRDLPFGGVEILTEGYTGVGEFQWLLMGTDGYTDDNGCVVSFSHATRIGGLRIAIGQGIRNGQPDGPDRAMVLGGDTGAGPVESLPHVQDTVTESCPGAPASSEVFPYTPLHFAMFMNALNWAEAGHVVLLTPDDVGNVGLGMASGKLQGDGSLLLEYPKTPLITANITGDNVKVRVHRQNSRLKLQPLYAP